MTASGTLRAAGLLGLLAAFLFAPAAHSQPASPGDWTIWAVRDIDLSAGQARIEMPSSASGARAIRLYVRDRGLILTRVAVIYASGPAYIETRTIRLLAGERTAPIGLSSEPRRVSAVEIFYRPQPRGPSGARLANVAIEGLPSAADRLAAERGRAESERQVSRKRASKAGRTAEEEDDLASADRRGPAAANGAAQPRPAPVPGAAPPPPSSGRGAPPPFATAPAPAPTPAPGAGTGGSLAGGARPSAPAIPAPAPGVPRGVVPAAPASPPPVAAMPPAASPLPPPPPPPVAAAPPSAPVLGAAPKAGATRSATSPAAADEPRTAASEAAKSADADKPYASVPVLFGTDRKRGETRKAKWGGDVDTFGGESDFKLQLGKAIVTVPTKEGVRERGSVPRPEFIVFGFRIPWGTEQLDKHFTVYSVRTLEEAGFLAEVRSAVDMSKSFEKHALLFVHGYNVTFEDSLYRTAQMAHDLQFDGAAFMYSWPSKGDPTAYLYDEDRAKGARPFLKDYLELIAAKTPVQHLHIVAHSKGAELLTEVLNTVSTSPDLVQRLKIDEIILAAPDIDRANFEQIADRIVGVAKRGVTLYASNNDKALSLSRTVRLGTVRAGDVPADRGPVLIKGMDTIDISAASTDFFSSNHITFAERQYLISDMRLILSGGQHPPDQRSNKLFKPIVLERGKYWQFIK